MKRLYTLVVAAVLTAVLYGQAPCSFKYQAVLRDATGNVKANSDVSIEIQILQGTVSGTQVFIESHDATTNEFGLVNLEIGSKNVSGISTIDWASGPYFLKISVDGVAMGISQLLSVPYARFADKAGNGFSGDYNDLINIPDFKMWDKDSTDNVTINDNQTISGNKTFIGEVNIPEPTNNSNAVTKKYADGLLETLSNKGVIAIDFEGNIYSTVRIGSQIWMAENLRTHHYNDGEVIPIIDDYHDWSNQTTAVCYEMYLGNYYNWFVVESGKLCPTGWKVPTDTQWIILSDFLGGVAVAGGKMKAGGFAMGNIGATNESGFTATASGAIGPNGEIDQMVGYLAGYWSSTELDATTAGSAGVNGGSSALIIGTSNKRWGYSVRCIKE